MRDIHLSGVNRKTESSTSNFLAKVDFPDQGNPQIKRKVGIFLFIKINYP